jgi:hypothetical protein
VVEVNPFGRMTGSSLWSWEGERRRLQGGLDFYGDLDDWEGRYPPNGSFHQPTDGSDTEQPKSTPHCEKTESSAEESASRRTGAAELPLGLAELTSNGTSLRYRTNYPPHLDAAEWTQLEVFWPDYLSLAPKTHAARPQ